MKNGSPEFYVFSNEFIWGKVETISEISASPLIILQYSKIFFRKMSALELSRKRRQSDEKPNPYGKIIVFLFIKNFIHEELDDSVGKFKVFGSVVPL